MALDQMNDIGDDVLLKRYANGDMEAASLLSARLTPGLLGFATRILRDLSEAEDVVQETMLRLWRMAPDWEQDRAKLSTWTYRVAKNLCTDRLRKRRNLGLDEVAEPVDDTPGAEARLMQSQRLNALDAALTELPERQRIAVVLRHIEEMSNPEIAEIMEISVEAVESLTARGKRALAATLASQKEELGL